MKECDKRNSHISSKLHMIYIFSNDDRQAVTKTFTTLHYTSPNYTALFYTCRHFISSQINFTQLHFTTLHCPLIWLNFLYVYHRTHLTSAGHTLELIHGLRETTSLSACYVRHQRLLILIF
jgi:hypothetical protein